MVEFDGPVAQSVEHRTENPSVDSSILSWPTIKDKGLQAVTTVCGPFVFVIVTDL
jgi:hypothetical protein